jgi:hypothetical protein
MRKMLVKILRRSASVFLRFSGEHGMFVYRQADQQPRAKVPVNRYRNYGKRLKNPPWFAADPQTANRAKRGRTPTPLKKRSESVRRLPDKMRDELRERPQYPCRLKYRNRCGSFAVWSSDEIPDRLR